MTQNNPYKSDADLDADIFETDAEHKSGEKPVHRHTIDGSVCHTCNIVHAVGGLPPDLPESIKEKILTLIDNIPDEILKKADGLLAAATPPQPKLVMDFMNFVVEMDNHNNDGPLIRAMAEYLDEQSDGAITRKWQVYDLERRLISSHLVLKSINQHLDESRAGEVSEDGLTLLEVLVDFMVDRISLITNEYRDKATTAGIEVDEDIINAGVYSTQQDTPKVTVTTMIAPIAHELEGEQ